MLCKQYSFVLYSGHISLRHVWIVAAMLRDSSIGKKDSAVKCLEVLSTCKPDHWKAILEAGISQRMSLSAKPVVVPSVCKFNHMLRKDAWSTVSRASGCAQSRAFSCTSFQIITLNVLSDPSLSPPPLQPLSFPPTPPPLPPTPHKSSFQSISLDQLLD